MEMRKSSGSGMRSKSRTTSDPARLSVVQPRLQGCLTTQVLVDGVFLIPKHGARNGVGC